MRAPPLEVRSEGGGGFGCPTCGHIACVCDIIAEHPDPQCRFRISATCAIPVECEHGRDVCPICDPCTCKKEEAPRLLPILPTPEEERRKAWKLLFRTVAEAESAREQQPQRCPACPDGYVWTESGPTDAECPVCNGTAIVSRAGESK